MTGVACQAPDSTQQRIEDVGLAIDVGGTKVHLALTDQGHTLGSARISSRDLPAAELVAALRTSVAQLLEAEGQRTLSVCTIARPGAVDEGGSLLSPNLPGWSDEAVRQMLSTEFGAGVTMVNDVQAATHAEVEAGALRGVPVGCYVNVGTGLSAGTAIDGRVVRGAHGVAGEIAYLPLGPGLGQAADPASDVAPLEERAGGAGLEQRAARLGVDSLAELFASSSPAATALIHDFAAAVSFAVSNLCAVVDPARVAFGGGIAAAFDVWAPLVAAQLEVSVPRPPELVRAHFTSDASLQGALLMVRESVGRTG